MKTISRHSNGVRLAGISLALSLVGTLFFGCGGFGACGGGGGGAGDVGSVARHLEDDTSFVVTTPSFEKTSAPLLEEWAKTKKNLDESGKVLSSWEDLKKSAEEESALDFDKLKKLKKQSGLDYDGPLAWTLAGDEQSVGILLAGVDDKSKFNKYFPELFGEVDVKKKKVDKIQIRTFQTEDSDAPAFSWAYGNGVVAIGLHNTGKTEPTQETVADFAQQKKSGESLQGHKGFGKFKSELLDGSSLGVFFNPDGDAADQFFESFQRQWCGKRGLFDSEVCKAAETHTVGLGFAASFKTGGELKTRGWMGMDSEGAKWLQKRTTAKKEYAWSNFATRRLTGGIRLAVNPEKFWKSLKSNLKDEPKNALQNQVLGQIEDASGGDFDLEGDVIEALSGQIGIFVYNLAGLKGGGSARQNAINAFSATQYAAVFQFKDAETLTETVSDLQSLVEEQMGEDVIDKEEMDSGLIAYKIELERGPSHAIPRLYVKDDILVLASMGVSKEMLDKRLAGDYPGGPVTKMDEVKLAGPFVEEAQYTGAYLHAGRLIDSLEKEYENVPEAIWATANATQEHRLRFDATDNGLVAEWESRNDFEQLRSGLTDVAEMFGQ